MADPTAPVTAAPSPPATAPIVTIPPPQATVGVPKPAAFGTVLTYPFPVRVPYDVTRHKRLLPVTISPAADASPDAKPEPVHLVLDHDWPWTLRQDPMRWQYGDLVEPVTLVDGHNP